jgi:DNA modification methylase
MQGRLSPETNAYGQTDRYPRTVQKFNMPNSGERGLHPTQKPVALYEYLIKTYTNPGDTVLDFCMGSGTTGVAAVKTGRNFIGIEKEPKYFEIAQKRIAEAQQQMVMAL